MTSNKYEPFTTPEHGRGLRAVCNLAAGDEVISEEPIVSTLMNTKRGSICDTCFLELERPLKCARCKFVYYCDANCQKLDWPAHKRECKCLQNVSPRQPPDLSRLAARLLFKFYCRSSADGGKPKVDPDGVIANLAAHRESLTSERREMFFTFAAVLKSYLHGAPIDFEEVDVFELLCKISCNSFSITNSELNSLGTGIYVTSSLLNHSCDPNVCATFRGTRISVRAMRDISRGEEIRISYTDLMQLSADRKRELSEGYMFECTCANCSDSARDLYMRAARCQQCNCTRLPVKLERPIGNLKMCSCDGIDHKQRESEASTCMDELDALYHAINVVPTADQQADLERLKVHALRLLSPVNLSLLHACEVAMDGCLETEKWSNALEYSLALEEGYRFYLSEWHPTRGIHYFKLGKLQLLLDFLAEGVDSLQRAYTVLVVTHGEENPLVRQLRQSIGEARSEMAARGNWNKIEKMNDGRIEEMIT